MHAMAYRALRWRFTLALLVLITIAPLGWHGAMPAASQPSTPALNCLTPTEPNDQPADATPLPPGASCVTAASSGPAQDLYRWTVSEAETTSRWTFAVSAVPAQVTRLEVYTIDLDAAGGIVTATLLVSALGGVNEPVSHDDLLWAPGDYYIAVATSGPGDYTLTIDEGAPVPPVGTSGDELSGSFELADTVDGAVTWSLDAADSESRWTLQLQGAVWQALSLTVTDEAGTTLLTAETGNDGIASMPDVGLAPGTYTLSVTGATGEATPWVLSATAAGTRAAGEEDEPNDTPSVGMPLVVEDGSAVVSGRLAKRGPADQLDRDAYRITVDDGLAGRFIDIRLLWQGEVERTLCLLDAAAQELKCERGTGGVALHDFVLAEGEYVIDVSGVPAPDVPYVLRVEASGEAVPRFETEPNDAAAAASPLVPDGDGYSGSGRLSYQDVDHFRVTVSGEPQLWLVAVDGDGLAQVDLLDSAGAAVMRAAPVETGFALVDAYLVPGDHVVRVSGSQGDYQVTLTPLGPPDPHHEREPNDGVDRSQPLRLMEERTGRLPTTADVDVYRFSLHGQTYLQTSVAVPADGAYTMSIAWQESEIAALTSIEPGAPLEFRGLLEPGDYTIWLRAVTPSEAPYAISLTPLDPYQLPDDVEPNGDPALARPVPESLRIAGIADPAQTSGDVDWYVLPPLDVPADWTIAHTPEVLVEVLTPGGAGVPPVPLPLIPGASPGEATVSLPEGMEVFVKVTGSGAYEVVLAPPGGPPPPATPAPDTSSLRMSLDLGDTPVAAYWPQGQRIAGELTIENAGDAQLDVALEARTGSAVWEVTLDSDAVAIGAGETVSVPIAVRVAADARADEPVFVAVRAAGDDDVASAMALVTPDRAAVPVSVEPWWPLPDGMLGGLNAAWTALGAAPVAVDEAVTASEAPLYDGITTIGTGWSTGTASLPVDLTVDLAGDEPVPVAGFTVFPAGTERGVGAQVRDVELSLSMDGQLYTTVASARLDPVAREQVIALEAPFDARFARLRVLSAWSPASIVVTLGEWKVIAAPDWAPDMEAGPNLADPSLGGHVVDLQPPLPNPRDSELLLVSDESPTVVEATAGDTVSWVIGFQHDRAGQVTALEWVDAPGSDPELRMERVLVEASTGSPVGPWEPLGEWDLERDASGTATLELDAPAWARFIRFSGSVPEGDDGTATIALPDLIRVVEREADGDYRSVLGEWGGDRRDATLELLEPVEVPVLDDDAGDDAEGAVALSLGETHTDVAAIGVDEDWYRIQMPAGMTELEVTLAGFPAVGVTAKLLDENGDSVETETSQVAADTVLVRASVEPGGTYLLRVAQPPTSVVIAFDTSFSIGSLEPTVYQGLNRFATDVEAGREFVNVLPFGEQLLLAEWSDDPYQLQGAIAAYPRTAISSDAEGAILTSTEAFEGRTGTKAIFLISDGESAPTWDQASKLWPALAATAPRIFTVGIAGSEDLVRGQDVMQDWATAGDGRYVYVRDQGAMDVAFDRAATELRRPAVYSVAVDASAAPATPSPAATPAPTATPTPTPTVAPTPSPTPEPVENGTLEVTAPAPEAGAPVVASTQGQVAIILDTSGSMLQPLEGSTRADVAKGALIDLVTTTIPPGTLVSLRTFGDTPDSCETLLAVPPGPLDPATMSETIAGLPVVDLVRTPIGAALEATLDDLATGEGPRIVVLVTDGEETCDGDPAEAIRALADSGVDVRVNIVGFAIADPVLAQTFESWAQIGNGRYIDAGDAGELNRAVSEAVLPTFDVIDRGGAVVASGQVGGVPVSLPPGSYRVVVHTVPERQLEVVVEPGQPTVVALE